MLLGRFKLWLGSPAGWGLGAIDPGPDPDPDPDPGPGGWVFAQPADAVDAGTAAALATSDIVDEGFAGALATADILDGGSFIQET